MGLRAQILGEGMEKQELIKLLKKQSVPYLDEYFLENKTNLITTIELMAITEENPEDFLARDERKGYFYPQKYAKEVFENFLGNETYYFEKLIRLKV